MIDAENQSFRTKKEVIEEDQKESARFAYPEEFFFERSQGEPDYILMIIAHECSFRGVRLSADVFEELLDRAQDFNN